MNTVYILTNNDYLTNEDNHIVGVYSSLEEAKKWETILLANPAYEDSHPRILQYHLDATNIDFKYMIIQYYPASDTASFYCDYFDCLDHYASNLSRFTCATPFNSQFLDKTALLDYARERYLEWEEKNKA